MSWRSAQDQDSKIIATEVLDLAQGLLAREQGKSRSKGERELRKGRR